MFKYTMTIFRVLVGTIFIISGLIKANDPIGFSYKMEEYFQVFASDFKSKKIATPIEIDENDPCASEDKQQYTYETVMIPEEELSGIKKAFIGVFKFLEKNALPLSVVIAVFEIVVGVMAVAGVFFAFTAWSLFLMIVFFTFLTFYSAYFNKVTDCGCFGDALKLKPWESFYKDVILSILIIPIFIFRNKIAKWASEQKFIAWTLSLVVAILLCSMVFSWWLPVWFIAAFALYHLFATDRLSFMKESWNVALMSTFIFTVFSIYCIRNLPVKDFRPWKVGNDVLEQMESKPEVSRVMMVYRNKATCQEVMMPTDRWDWLDSTFESTHVFLRQHKEVIEEYQDAPIKDFTLENPEDGESMAMAFIRNKGLKVLIVAYDLRKTDVSAFAKIKTFSEELMANGVMVVAGTSSADLIDDFRHEHQLMFPFYVNDATSLKTINRSNPGIVVMKGSKVIGQYHHRNLPDAADLLR